MAGLDYLLAMKSGELPKPPFAGFMQIDIVSAEPGRVVFTGQPDESMYNAAGVIHGGVVGMLLDTVAECALQSTLPAGKGYTSVEIKVNYLKTVRLDSGLLTATGTLLRRGRGSVSQKASSPTPVVQWWRRRRAHCYSSTITSEFEADPDTR
jgi:uncharacterized protein (TIGR00369 family)